MSLPKPLLRSGLRAVRPLLSSSKVALGTKRSIVDHVVSMSRAPEGAVYDFDTLAGLDVHYVTVDANRSRQGRSTILYLHGGGNVLGSARAYRGFAANLSQASGMDVILPEYPLAPESPYPMGLDALMALYVDLPKHGITHDSVVLAGDASGGGLALALTMRIRDEGLPMPSAIGLLSPWLDMVADIERRRESGGDPWMTPSLTASWALPYVGRHDPHDAGISPLHGDVTNLPAIVVHYAEQDPLRSDVEALLERLVDLDGAPRVIAREYPEMWHGFHVMAGRMTIADEAVLDFAESLQALTEGHHREERLAEVVPINRPVAARGGHLTAVSSKPEAKTPTARA